MNLTIEYYTGETANSVLAPDRRPYGPKGTMIIYQFAIPSRKDGQKHIKRGADTFMVYNPGRESKVSYANG